MTDSISVCDRGFTLGDGLFETVLWDKGRPVFWNDHMQRMAAACGVLGLPVLNRERALAAAREAVSRQDLVTSRAAVRLTWTAGEGARGLSRSDMVTPAMVVTAAPAVAPTAPVRLVTSGIRRNDTSPISRLKTLSYLDNVLARRAAGTNDAIMLNTRGEVACATAANLFWVEKDQLFTPALECGILPGVVRAVLIARLRECGIAVEEVAVPRARLDVATSVALTNSLIGLLPVAVLDGRELKNHPLLAAAIACLSY